MKATSLAPFLEPLDDNDLARSFSIAMLASWGEVYPAQPDGKVLARFPTISVLAQR